jgi:hypothetical protein
MKPSASYRRTHRDSHHARALSCLRDKRSWPPSRVKPRTRTTTPPPFSAGMPLRGESLGAKTAKTASRSTVFRIPRRETRAEVPLAVSMSRCDGSFGEWRLASAIASALQTGARGGDVRVGVPVPLAVGMSLNDGSLGTPGRSRSTAPAVPRSEVRPGASMRFVLRALRSDGSFDPWGSTSAVASALRGTARAEVLVSLGVGRLRCGGSFGARRPSTAAMSRVFAGVVPAATGRITPTASAGSPLSCEDRETAALNLRARLSPGFPTRPGGVLGAIAFEQEPAEETR